jgi:hypothetical protein
MHFARQACLSILPISDTVAFMGDVVGFGNNHATEGHPLYIRNGLELMVMVIEQPRVYNLVEVVLSKKL